MSESVVKGQAAANGGWTRHGVVRETTARGEISFDPDVIAGSPFSLRLRSVRTGEVFSNEVSWTDGDTGRKVLATNVLPHTRFTVDSRGSQGKRDFSGKLFTA